MSVQENKNLNWRNIYILPVYKQLQWEEWLIYIKFFSI